MKEIKLSEEWHHDSMHPDALPVLVSPTTGKMTCVCNYELIRQDANTWKCTGGGHVYELEGEEPEIFLDSWGNTMVKVKGGKS